MHRTALAAAELAVTVGRLDERLAAIHRALDRHMQEEHKDFLEALKKVDLLNETVRDLHSAAKVTRWVAAVATTLFGVAMWLKNHVSILP